MSGLTVDPNYCSHVPKSDRVGDERPWCVACLRRDNAELKARVAELERERDAAIKERDEARAEVWGCRKARDLLGVPRASGAEPRNAARAVRRPVCSPRERG